MNIRTLAARVPILEVAFRHCYWRIPWLRKFALSMATRRPTAQFSEPLPLLDEFIAQARSFGVSEGDVLIVHSSTDRFSRSGISVGLVLSSLLELVGKTGTVVMPAIPLLKEEPKPEKRFDDALYQKSFTYRKGRERIWTGMLPMLMARHPGAVLSKVPINTLVALGAKAEEIIAGNSREIVTPCGPGSAWEHCYRLNAKILMVDVNIAHSLTMIHTVEDLFSDEWPIAGWYRDRTFRIVEGKKVSTLSIKERHPKWGLFFCENQLNRDLIESSVFRSETTPSGLTVALADTATLVEFLRRKRPSSYPYLIPSRYRKDIK